MDPVWSERKPVWGQQRGTNFGRKRRLRGDVVGIGVSVPDGDGVERNVGVDRRVNVIVAVPGANLVGVSVGVG